jgi:short-subunit dehydrogenase
MKALVIGGTKGFGYEISKNLADKKYETVTIGRSPDADIECDISNPIQLEATLKDLRSNHRCLDLIACVVGYARAKPKSKLTRRFYEQVFRANLGYVEDTFEHLTENLLESTNPRVFTIGSLFSYRRTCPELLPYVQAKRQLSEFIRNVSTFTPKIKTNMFCVPTMKTPGYQKVLNSFKQLNLEDFLENAPKADPKIIARSLVESALETEGSGETFAIDRKGRVSKLTKHNPKHFNNFLPSPNHPPPKIIQ